MDTGDRMHYNVKCQTGGAELQKSRGTTYSIRVGDPESTRRMEIRSAFAGERLNAKTFPQRDSFPSHVVRSGREKKNYRHMRSVRGDGLGKLISHTAPLCDTSKLGLWLRSEDRTGAHRSALRTLATTEGRLPACSLSKLSSIWREENLILLGSGPSKTQRLFILSLN